MPKAEGHGKPRRILIASYGNVFVPELIKLLDDKNKYCLFVLFNDANEIGFIQKGLGKKRLIPLLTGISEEVKGQEISDDLIKSLPDMDCVINLDNSASISKFYEKRKRFNTTEMKLAKITVPDLKTFIDSSSEAPSLLNVIPESTIGLKHMFDTEGLEVPIRTHISTSFQNSFRKLFLKKKSHSEPPATNTDARPPTSSSSGKSTDLIHNQALKNENASQLKNQSRVSILKKKKDPLVATRSDPQVPVIVPNMNNAIHVQIGLKENASYKKSLNKLHAKYLQRQIKEMRKLEAGKSKDQNAAEKIIEEEARLEKGRLESKCNDLNSTTLARSTALTPDTANKIIASREARVNKEVYRNANRKKVTEFEKIEECYQEKVSQFKSKQAAQLLKIQQESLERTRKKYEERLIKKTVHRSKTLS